MLTEIDRFASSPTSGRAYFRGTKEERLDAVRRMLRADIAELRLYETRRQALIDACDGEPQIWVASATNTSHVPGVRPMDRTRPCSVADVQIIAGSEDQARAKFRQWRDLVGTMSRSEQHRWEAENLFPSAPVQQAWWPNLLRETAARIHDRLRIAIA